MAGHAVILAGGKGSRLRPFTVTIPKPLVPIGDLPIVEILIRQLAAAGIDRITISTGHLASLIEAFCGDGGRWGVPIDYVYEDTPLGTIGCLALLDDVGGDRVLVVNGDTLTDFDFATALPSHDPEDGITIYSNRRSVQVEFGVLETDGDGYLSGYREKPELSYDVSMGINVLSSWVIDKYIPAERLDLPDLVLRLVQDGEKVRVRPTDAYWLDLGRMADLEAGAERFRTDPGRFLPEGS